MTGVALEEREGTEERKATVESKVVEEEGGGDDAERLEG